MILFIGRVIASLQMIFRIINYKNQYDRYRGAAHKKSGTKIEFLFRISSAFGFNENTHDAAPADGKKFHAAISDGERNEEQ